MEKTRFKQIAPSGGRKPAKGGDYAFRSGLLRGPDQAVLDALAPLAAMVAWAAARRAIGTRKGEQDT